MANEQASNAAVKDEMNKLTLILKKHLREWRQANQVLQDCATVGVVGTIVVGLGPEHRRARSETPQFLVLFMQELNHGVIIIKC